MASKYSDTEKQRYMSALQDSAARSATGDPVWKEVAKETGVTRDTLRRWWGRMCRQNDDATEGAEVVPLRPEMATAEDVQRINDEELFAWMFAFQRECAIQARKCNSFGGIPKLLDGMERSYQELAKARDRRRRSELAGLSDTERAIELRRVAGSMSPKDGLVFAEALKRRGLA